MNEIPTHQADTQTDSEVLEQSPQEDRVIFQRTWNLEKTERHVDNIQHLTGFYHGKYYINGVGQGGQHEKQTVRIK